MPPKLRSGLSEQRASRADRATRIMFTWEPVVVDPVAADLGELRRRRHWSRGSCKGWPDPFPTAFDGVKMSSARLLRLSASRCQTRFQSGSPRRQVDDLVR